MKKLKLLIYSILALVLSSCVSVKEYESDLTLKELQVKMEQAVDSKGYFANSSSYFQKQMLNIEGVFSNDLYEINIKFKKPHFLKITTLKFNQLHSEVIVNNNAAWSVDYKEKKVTPIQGDELKRFLAFYTLMTPSTKYEELFKDIKLSICVIDDKEYYKIDCKTQDNSDNRLILYVDTQDYLTKKIDIDFEIPYKNSTKEIKSLTNIDSYEVYKNVMYPSKYNTITNGVESETTVYEYLLNIPLHDDEFKPPIFNKDSNLRTRHRLKMLKK